MIQNVSLIVKKLFWINVAVFILSIFIKPIVDIFALYPLLNEHYHFYQLFTYMFLHGSFLHIFFNMLTFVSIGGTCSDYFGEKKFLLYYIIIGVLSGLCQVVLVPTSPVIGASGAIFGMIAIFGLLEPNTKFFPGIKAKYLISIIVGFEIIAVIMNWKDGIGHYAHLIGALTGVTLYYLDSIIYKG